MTVRHGVNIETARARQKRILREKYPPRCNAVARMVRGDRVICGFQTCDTCSANENRSRL